MTRADIDEPASVYVAPAIRRRRRAVSRAIDRTSAAGEEDVVNARTRALTAQLSEVTVDDIYTDDDDDDDDGRCGAFGDDKENVSMQWTSSRRFARDDEGMKTKVATTSDEVVDVNRASASSFKANKANDDARRARRRHGRLARCVVEQWRWFVAHERGVTTQRKTREAEEARERRVKRNAFDAWKGSARDGRHERLRAGIYWRLGVMQRVFEAWRAEVGADARREAEEARAAKARAESDRARAATQIAWYHDWRRTVSGAFTRWRDEFVPRAREERMETARYERYANKTLTKRALDAWRMGCERQIVERTNALVASSFDEIRTYSRVMRAWKMFVIDARVEDEVLMQKVVQFKTYAAVNKTAAAFTAWVDVVREARNKPPATPAKTRAERTKRALYAWLFDRSKANAFERRVLEYLDERADDDDAVDEEDDFPTTRKM
jgi:hypothetical protein